MYSAAILEIEKSEPCTRRCGYTRNRLAVPRLDSLAPFHLDGSRYATARAPLRLLTFRAFRRIEITWMYFYTATGGRTGGWTGGRTDGRTGGRTDGRAGGRVSGQTEGWAADGRLDGSDGGALARGPGRGGSQAGRRGLQAGVRNGFNSK